MKFIINNNTLTIEDAETVNSGSVSNYGIEVETDESWNGLSMVVKIFNERENTGIERAVIDGMVYIDIDTLERYSIGFIGYTLENGVKVYQKSTNLRILPYTRGAGELRNVDSQELPTASEWEIYLQQVQEFINNANQTIDQAEDLIEQMDTSLEQVDEAIEKTNRLNLDANKVNKTTTVTLTKKDGTVKTIHINDGLDLQFIWQGTSLGIKTEDQQEYTFVDLQGVQGPKGDTGAPFTIKKTYPSIQAMDADFNNMQLGDYVMIAGDVQTEDNAKLFTRGQTQWIFISDFSGAQGIQGPTGATPNIQIGTVTSGSFPNVTRTGTNENPILNFVLQKGDTGETGPIGPTGNGIATIEKTSTTGAVDTYTITYTNGNTTTFTVTNGEVTQSQLDAVSNKVNDLQNIINQMPAVPGEGTIIITLNNTLNAPFLQFDISGNSDQNGTPTSTNEVPILSAGNNGIITEKIINKNWFDKANTVWKKNNSNSFDIGTLDNNTSRIRTSSFPIIGGKTYIISGYPSTVSLTSVRGFDKNKEPLSGAVTRNDNILTLSSEVYYIHILFGGENFDASTNEMMANANIQIEEGTTATNYIEYQLQNFVMPVQQSMKSVKSTRDTFEKINNVLNEIHNIGVTIYDGSSDEAWSYFQGVVFIDNPNVKGYSGNSLNFLTNYFLAESNKCYLAHSTHQRLHINLGNEGLSEITSVSAWRTWLSTHNLIFQYELATPINLACTQEQISTLKSLPLSYSNLTNIYTEDTSPAYIKSKALLDLNTLINS